MSIFGVAWKNLKCQGIYVCNFLNLWEDGFLCARCILTLLLLYKDCPLSPTLLYLGIEELEQRVDDFVKQEGIEVANDVIILLFLSKWCEPFHKCFRRYPKAYACIGKLLYV